MAGNLFPIILHPTFDQKVQNFPDDIYNFDTNDNLTLLMKTMLGNAGTGQLSMLQTVARLIQQNVEFSNLDTILGSILNIKRLSSEIYSFSTNPFIDQLTVNNWQEISRKDASYRERLLGAAEAFQLGATVWGILTLAEAITQIPFTVVESWKTPNLGRFGSLTTEVVLVPTIDDGGKVTWTQDKANALLQVMGLLLPSNFVVSFGTPQALLKDVTAVWASATEGYSENFYMQRTVQASNINNPAVIQPGSSTRYWLQNSTTITAPVFAHLQTQEKVINLTRNINSVTLTGDSTALPQDSLSSPSLSITATVYGAQ